MVDRSIKLKLPVYREFVYKKDKKRKRETDKETENQRHTKRETEQEKERQPLPHTQNRELC